MSFAKSVTFRLLHPFKINMKCKDLLLLALFICAAMPPLVACCEKCHLEKFKSEHFANSARVHTGFKSSIDRISGYAARCGVKVLVTSSFRKYGRPIHGPTVVPPATSSNHFVGHAIDMNLYEGGRLCNSKCLVNPPVKLRGVKCFISSIRDDTTLRWGGEFRRKDVVHIDDGLNVRDRPLYNRLFVSLQKNCK